MELSCRQRPRPEEHALKADSSAQLRLLDLQEVDASLDQYAHRRKTLPEQAKLSELESRRSDVDHRHGLATTAADDLAREQRKADADVEQVKARRQRNQDRIDGGQVTDSKQLQALQHENESLVRRISDLEDEELDVMERLETAQSEQSALGAERTDLDAAIVDARSARDAALSEIEQGTTDAQAERDALAGQIPDDLLALYDRLRGQLGGVGVGALRQKRCGGCRLDVGAAELARIANAPSDEVFRCEECNRILVRTPESGI